MCLKKTVNRSFRILSLVSLMLILFSCGSSKSALKISDGTMFESKDYFPDFSWKTTPMYYHFGDINRVLKPDEVNFIADRTTFITIEKSHAYKMLGDAVLGAQHEATAFHNVNPDIKVLYYFNSFVAWPFTRFNKKYNTEEINKHPELKDFLAVNYKTGELLKKTNGAALSYYFNVLNPDFRKWWVKSVVQGVEISGCDGVFIDRMNIGGHSGYSKDKAIDVEKAKGEMMAELKAKLGPDKILIGNNAAGNKYVFPYCDGFMFEHYNKTVTNKENLLKEWDDMVKVAKAGKISIYRFGAKGRGPALEIGGEPRAKGLLRASHKQIQYYLSCYLIGAQPYSYFQYNWGWNLENGNLVNYPDLMKPLGAPKGAYKRVTPDGWEFTREFEHASVWVNTETRKAKITWKD